MTLADDHHHWQRHEMLLATLGLLAALLLAVRAGPLSAATICTAIATAAFCMVVTKTRNQTSGAVQKFRFAAAYLFVLWFYKSVQVTVPALRIPTHDATLLELDNQLFGVTPAIPIQALTSCWLNELMSGCYLSYLAYLHVCVVYSLWMPLEFARRFANWLYSIYVIGLAGYLLFPARGPANAFPELFGPELEGIVLTPLNRIVVQNGASVYDAFPSLHVLITCALLEFDRRNCRRRFYWMILPVVGIFASTIYLRYHYAVDLIAGGLLFVAARLCFGKGSNCELETGNAD